MAKMAIRCDWHIDKEAESNGKAAEKADTKPAKQRAASDIESAEEVASDPDERREGVGAFRRRHFLRLPMRSKAAGKLCARRVPPQSHPPRPKTR